MDEFRRIAANIDQHMQQLSSQGINTAPAIINRMVGYIPSLHQILAGASGSQLLALSNGFPRFSRYALIMEEAYEAERNKASPPYDGMAQLPGQLQQQAAQLLTTAAELERGYQALLGAGGQQAPQPRQWTGCTSNGLPVWNASTAPYVRRALTQGQRRTWKGCSGSLPGASSDSPVDLG